MKKQDLIKNIKSPNNNLVEEFLKNGGKIKICKPTKIGKTWSDLTRGSTCKIGHMSGSMAYGR